MTPPVRIPSTPPPMSLRRLRRRRSAARPLTRGRAAFSRVLSRRTERSPQEAASVLATRTAAMLPDRTGIPHKASDSSVGENSPPRRVGAELWGRALTAGPQSSARLGAFFQQREVIRGDEPGCDGVLDRPCPAVDGELSRFPAQAPHTVPVQLVAHVVELAVEPGDGPAESL